MDETDPKEYASQARYPTTKAQVVQFFKDAGYSSVSLCRVTDHGNEPRRSWHLQVCLVGTQADVANKFASDAKESGLKMYRTAVGAASDADERAVYNRAVLRVCTAKIPWDEIVYDVAENVVDGLLEADDVTAEPVAQKAEVKILPAVGLDHHHDVVLVSDQEPVYVGTIAPKSNVWRVVKTAANVGRKMRTELHWTMPTKEECALRMVEVMRQFWKPVIAGHAVAESADDLDPKAFVNREFGRLRTWRDLQKYPDDQVFACYDPTVAKDRGLKIPFYCWSATWKGGGVVSVAFEGGTEKIDARLFDLGYGARTEQYDFVPVTSLKPVARVGTEATFESDDAVDPKEFVNDHFKYLYIVRRDESAWFNRGIVNSAKAPVVGVFRRRETAVNYASNMGGMVYRTADTSPVVKSWLIAGNKITESEESVDPKEYVNFTLSRGCTLQERAGRNGHTAEEPVLDVVGPNGKILGTVYVYEGGEWCGVKRDPSGDLDLGSDAGYTDSIERAAEYVIGLHDISRLESVADDIDKEAQKAEKPASPEQAEAGNYKKGHVSIQGMEIAIENAKGSTRSGTGKDGKTWSVTMPSHYGYLKGTLGKDKDHLDAYIGENPGGMLAFVVNQKKIEGGFDEHKIMLGFSSKDEAIATYDRAFTGDLGPKLRETVISTTVDKLKEWIKSGNTKKPFEAISEGFSAWHASPASFKKFDTSREGAHFGTRYQADNLRKPGKKASKQFILDIKNPLRIRDMGTWTLDGIATELFHNDVFSQEDYDAVRAEYNMSDERGFAKLKDILASKGHDGLVYANEQEGEGDSYVAFDSGQIKPVRESEAIVDTLLETDEEVDPKDYVGDDPYPGLALDPLPGNRDAWQVFRRGRTGYSACLGTLFFDLHSDMAPEAHLHWKDANWIASPISPNRPIRAFRTKDEAIAYLKS